MKGDAYLIIHGFAGTTTETGYLEAYLRAKGLETFTVLLAGHGGTKQDLTASSDADWVRSATLTAETLAKSYENLNIIGFSMGGLISVQLASSQPVNKIIFVNTPIYFWNANIIVRDIVNDIRNNTSEMISYYLNSAFGVSIKSSTDFLHLLTSSKKKLMDIKCPALIVQCTEDESVHYKSANYIKRKLGRQAILRIYNGGCHQLFTKSLGLRDIVCEDIYEFLTKS
jgi:carboxylesterase